MQEPKYGRLVQDDEGVIYLISEELVPTFYELLDSYQIMETYSTSWYEATEAFADKFWNSRIEGRLEDLKVLLPDD